LPPPLVPPRKETSPEQLAAEIARLDRALVVVVLAFAFLLALVAVRNSDFWMHLATGRLIAHGQYQFGTDPFSYTSTVYWANHAWLYDSILYGLATAAGGPESKVGGAVLVVVKALLVTLLAWFMLKIRRPGQSLWIPALCTALAFLAMSPRLLFQPTLASMLLLSLTLYILQQPDYVNGEAGPLGQSSRPSPKVYWLLVPLFVLWVNVDSWFVLGPITVALFLLGELLQRFLSPATGAESPQPSRVGALAVVLVVGLAACLVNPHHYHAFALPGQLPLTPSAEVLEREDLFRPFFYWLLQDDYWQSYAAWTIAGLAYWPLMGLGLASFLCTVFAGCRWWRLTIWLAFLLLSGYQVRAIPFFAVVAAPITALNWQDVLAGRFGTLPRVDRPWKAWSLAGRVLTLLLGVGLLAAAWSGWLNLSYGFPVRPPTGRRVDWTVYVDPSLRKTALQLKAWRDQGLLGPEEHGFNYSPDVANYSAWFCPEQKGFFDYRLDLFTPELAREFVDTRLSLRGNLPPAGDSARRPVDWQEVFRNHHINHVVLYGNDSSPLNPGIPNALQAAIWMLFDPQHWTLLYMDGRTTIFRWNDSSSRVGAHQLAISRLDPNLRAFGPQPERVVAVSTEQAPPQRDWSTRLLKASPTAPLDRDEAVRYLDYFNLIRQQWPFPALAATEIANWSGSVGQAAVAAGSVAAPATLALRTYPNLLALPLPFANPRALEFFLRDKPYGPAAAPVLAVRAARRAIAASPDYPESYFALAEAYAMLWRDQEEHWVGLTSTAQDLPRRKLRETQLLTALEYYLMLRPDDGEAHWKLFQNYARLEFLDLALDHLRAATELNASRGPVRRESREEFKKRLDQMEQELGKLKAEVKTREDDYQVDARDKPLQGKVQKAIQNRLIKRARDLLLEADPAQLGPREIDLLINLLLSTGRPDQARAILSEGWQSHLGINYEWYNALIGAASGTYRDACQFLEEYITRFEQSNLEGALRLLEMQTFQGGLSPGSLYGVGTIANRAREAADLRTLRGMLALEQGENAVASKFFQAALAMGDREKFHFEGRPLAVRYLQLLKEAGGAQ
jgi:hypothetical protein